MKGIIFFFLFTFFISSVCGYIFRDYLVGVVDFNNIILKGPWDVNIGILVMIGLVMYFIAKKIFLCFYFIFYFFPCFENV